MAAIASTPIDLVNEVYARFADRIDTARSASDGRSRWPRRC